MDRCASQFFGNLEVIVKLGVQRGMRSALRTSCQAGGENVKGGRRNLWMQN